MLKTEAGNGIFLGENDLELSLVGIGSEMGICKPMVTYILTLPLTCGLSRHSAISAANLRG